MYTIKLLGKHNTLQIRDDLEKAVEKDGRFTCRLTISVDAKEIYVQQVRLTKAKPYCGQHPGECAVGGPKRKMKYLEWEDWVEFHGLVNKALDRRRVSADVWSNPHDTKGKFWIRKGLRARVKFEWTEGSELWGRPIRVWNNGTDDQFRPEKSERGAA